MSFSNTLHSSYIFHKMQMPDSSVQLDYFAEMVEQTFQYVKKEHNAYLHDADRSIDEVTIPEIFAIQVERFVNVHTKTTQDMHRIFVRGYDHKEYSSVGWLLKRDVDNCLICNAQFGFFCYKYNCRACGNVVCNSCRPHLASIMQLKNLKPQPVCLQCFWGQVQIFFLDFRISLVGLNFGNI